ncbi:MAG: hypothetical protein B7X99_17480 [Rhizobiales bacterium 17-65-6]|nr:MAG: hypothetical protein B7Y75_02935 [Azorhizobium sp. 35-67-5]OYZ90287.1 MAG: hypothetical protein B7X99_17480 [Rhizobiales bacterium 17-65-6]
MSEEITYAARPRMIGPGSRFRLCDGVLEWSVGVRSGTLRLADVTSVRLSYHPGQLAAPNYEMRLRGRDGTDLKIGSLSRTSITGVEDNRAAFSAFVRAVHSGLRGRAGVDYAAGLPRWRWWLMSALAVVTGCGLLAVLFTAIGNAQWTVTAVLAILCPVLAWPLVETLWRNIPADYAPDALPPRLVPA